MRIQLRSKRRDGGEKMSKRQQKPMHQYSSNAKRSHGDKSTLFQRLFKVKHTAKPQRETIKQSSPLPLLKKKER